MASAVTAGSWVGEDQVKIKLALPARNPTSGSRRDRSCRCQLRVQEGREWGREAPAHLLEAFWDAWLC